MKYKKLFVILIISISFTLGPKATFAQDSFNSDEFYQFLRDHENMESQEFLNMYSPKTTYWSKTGTPAHLNSFEYLDSIRIKYELTDDELTALEDRHFVVTERLSFPSMGDAFIDIFRKDLPVFVSTDAILQAFHLSYDKILKSLEYAFLIPDLHKILDGMVAAYPKLLNQYQSNEEMENALMDVDLYITMAKSLLDGYLVAPQLMASETFQQYWSAVEAEEYVVMPLFTETSRKLDFSQFTVRGHYTDSQELSRYFRSMMWLGRMDFLLTQSPDSLPETDIRRMNLGTVLLNELLILSVERSTLDEMDEIITFMVGESDNLTSSELQEIITDEGIERADDLLNETVYTSFQSAIKQSPFSEQKILSNIFIYDGFDEPQSLPVSFKLLGQRFIIDSYIFSKVVFPWIRYQNSNIWRPMPNPLDAMFAIGNDDALQLIKDELDTYKYSSSLAGVRYLVDAYDEDFWSKSLYNTWLNTLRSLNPSGNNHNLPFFMKTTGWHQQKLNTQLASWSQLRHDNLLYAKQSYTGGAACWYPHGYVEPYPEFYKQIGLFAEKAGSYFATLSADDSITVESIVNYYEELGSIVDTLETLALKELDGTPFNEIEIDFLRRVLTSEWQPNSSGPAIPPDGWYIKLFYLYKYDEWGGAYEDDYIVADVHTQPTDASGSMVGRVLHVGVGQVNLGIYLVDQTPSGDSSLAYVGPAMSYYEHITENFDRLTDERWYEIVDAGHVPPRPDWVNIYLMDSTGSGYSQGRELAGEIFMGLEKPDPMQPAYFRLHQNYPNPFNPITTIHYEIPKQSTVTIKIYNLLGKEVKTLVNTEQVKGNHQAIWDGTNDRGKSVSAGVYIYQIRMDGFTKNRKMVLLR
ncbi:MAG: DUF3160 domain-containing protein [Fidelibacterota bacterium]